MSNEQTNITTTNAADTGSTAPITAPEDERPALVKKIGKTTYKVRVHFSTTSTETMSDKIKRMLKNEVRQMRAFCKLDEKVLDKMFLELYDETFLE